MVVDFAVEVVVVAVVELVVDVFMFKVNVVEAIVVVVVVVNVEVTLLATGIPAVVGVIVVVAVVVVVGNNEVNIDGSMFAEVTTAADDVNVLAIEVVGMAAAADVVVDVVTGVIVDTVAVFDVDVNGSLFVVIIVANVAVAAAAVTLVTDDVNVGFVGASNEAVGFKLVADNVNANVDDVVAVAEVKVVAVVVVVDDVVVVMLSMILLLLSSLSMYSCGTIDGILAAGRKHNFGTIRNIVDSLQ